MIEGHDMVSTNFPEYDGELITSKIKIGSEIYKTTQYFIDFEKNLTDCIMDLYYLFRFLIK